MADLPGADGRLRCAVIGSPISHSLSPLLHRAAGAACGLEGFSYGRFEVGPGELASFLDAHPDLTGLSLTMPLKAELLALAADRGWSVEETAAATGAGNTLIRTSDGGDVLNTDVDGIVAALEEAGFDLLAAVEPTGEASADVLGAGATAASALTACARLGISSVRLFVRNRTRAASARAVAEGLGLDVRIEDLPDWVPGEVRLTLSTLPAGALDASRIPMAQADRSVVFDVAYSAAAADLQRTLADAGSLVIDGSRMLLHQAVEQFVRFAAASGREVDRSAALSAMDAALRAR